MFAHVRSATTLRRLALSHATFGGRIGTCVSSEAITSVEVDTSSIRCAGAVVTVPSVLFRSTGTSMSTKSFVPPTSPKGGSSGGPSPSSNRATTRMEQFKSFSRDGYLVVKNMFTPQEISALHDDITAIARGRCGVFEGYAPAEGQMTDLEAVSRYSRIEFPHKLLPALKGAVMQHPKMVEVLTNLIGSDIKAMSTKLYIDGPGDRGRSWHQDESAIPTRDRSLLCAIVALDDHTAETGCLMVHPGSHKSGILFRVGSTPSTASAECAAHDAAAASAAAAAAVTPAPSSSGSESEPVASSSAEDSAFAPSSASAAAVAAGADLGGLSPDVLDSPMDDGVPIELSTGSVVFINGYTLYRMLPQPFSSDADAAAAAAAAAGASSGAAGASASPAALAPAAGSGAAPRALRRALKVHYSSAKSLLPWWVDGKVAPTADNRDIVMITGVDPYAYKGITPTLSVPKAHMKRIPGAAAAAAAPAPAGAVSANGV